MALAGARRGSDGGDPPGSRSRPERHLRARRGEQALALLAAHGAALRRTASRFSLCADDADDALSRALVIFLARPPGSEPHRLAAWMHVVVRHEALAVRRARERLLARLPGDHDSPRGPAPLEALAADAPDPAARFERDERVADARRALAGLKADERLALLLQAQGYSYAEIASRCGWTYTKVNRCLAEGRARLRSARAARPAD